MIIHKSGLWFYKAGIIFTYERLYEFDGKSTPYCKVGFRYTFKDLVYMVRHNYLFKKEG